MSKIRMITKSDIPALKIVLESIELFPSEMLEDMISDYLTNEDSQDIWFATEQNKSPVSIGYCAPEKMTEGTFNLYAIGVRKDLQGQGIGSKMMDFIEQHLREMGHRVLIVDTSGTDDFKLTRKFYEKLAYDKEAVIRDFWDEGDDKIVFRKKLN